MKAIRSSTVDDVARLLDRAAAVLRGAATRGPAVSWRRPSSPREAGSLTR